MLTLLLVVALSAQTPSPLISARIEGLAEQTWSSWACDHLGYSSDGDQVAILNEGADLIARDGNIPRATVDAMIVAASQRHAERFEAERRTMMVQLEISDEAAREAVHSLVNRQSAICAAGSANPDIPGAFVPPADISAGEVAFADELLTPLGLSSWMTPEIFARGELMYAVGSCRSRISAGEHDRLLSGYSAPPPGADGRAVDYIAGWYSQGLSDSVELSFGPIQCRRLIDGRVEAAGAAQ